MLAAKDEYLQEAAETIFQLSAYELVRKHYRDRENYYQDLRNHERAIAAQDVQIQQLLTEIEALKAQN